jgi:hypothetical protein
MSTVLIGTAHIDFKGPERLRRFLQYYQPTTVISERGLHYDEDDPQKRSPEQRREILVERYPGLREANPDSLARFSETYSYEIWVPREYASQQEGRNHILVDIDAERLEIEAETIDRTGPGAEQGNGSAFNYFLSRLLSLPPDAIQELVDSDFYSAALINSDQGMGSEELLVERNISLAQEIMPYAGDVMSVGGVHHVYRGDRNVWYALKDRDIVAVRHKLIEADKPQFQV